MPRGGYRPGAGAKKGSQHHGTLDKLALREAARKQIEPHIAEMIEAQAAHAKGLKYLVTRDATGKFIKVTEAMAGTLAPDAIVEVWEKEPSTQAFTDLMNRALDKPAEQKQEIDVTITNTLQAKVDAVRKRGQSRS